MNFLFFESFYILFRIISEWRIFKMKKKIVTLFIVLLIAIGAFVILKPIYAAQLPILVIDSIMRIVINTQTIRIVQTEMIKTVHEK